MAYGAGRGQASFGFAWMHPDGAEWGISAGRVGLLLKRIQSALSPEFARRRRFTSEIPEGVLAHTATAA